MQSSPQVCSKCSAVLANGVLVCPKCGAPAANSFFLTPQVEARSPRRGSRFWIGLSLLLGGGACACLAVGMIALYLTGNLNLFNSSPPGADLAAQQTAPVVVTQVTATQPAATVTSPAPATSTPLPPASAPTAQIVTASPAAQVRFYSDDFSDPNSGWDVQVKDTYSVDYYPGGVYGMTLKTPSKMAVVIPPYPFTRPVGDLVINVKLKGEGGNGYYGVMCHRTDPKNYIQVSLANGYYAVVKVVDGNANALTDPYWKEIIQYAPDAEGWVRVSLVCGFGRIQLLVDDIGQEIITETDLTTGDAALFVSAGDKVDAQGVYMQGFFDDFTAEIPQ